MPKRKIDLTDIEFKDLLSCVTKKCSNLNVNEIIAKNHSNHEVEEMLKKLCPRAAEEGYTEDVENIWSQALLNHTKSDDEEEEESEEEEDEDEDEEEEEEEGF